MNYIGSKLSLLGFLTETVTAVAGDVSGCDFADLFAGTGAVGSAFRAKGCRVVSNDIQYYSYVLNRHLIENTDSPAGDIFDRLNALPGADGFVYKNFCPGSGSGRSYFSDENGRRCDAVRQEVERLRPQLGEDLYFRVLASLISSIDKYANTASVYGAFLKNIKKTAAKSFYLEPLPVIPGERGKVYNEDILGLVKRVKGDILYLDPPYNARQYCTNYHVLETVARYDNPVLRGVTGLREYSSQKSEFCSKKTAAAALDRLLSEANYKYVFLSYNNEGLLPLGVIEEIMKRHGRYEVFTTDHRRFKADTDENRSHKADKTMEYLHCMVK